MSDRISLQKLRDNEGSVPCDETVAALVEAVEAIYEVDGFPAHTWRCEYRTAIRGWKPGEPPIIECQCGLDRLEAALARFDFGDGRAV